MRARWAAACRSWRAAAQPGDLREAYRKAFGQRAGRRRRTRGGRRRQGAGRLPGNAAHAAHALRRLPRRGGARRPRRRGALPAAAQRGLALFLGRGRCYVCHAGPHLQQRRVPATSAVPHLSPSPAGSTPGRHGGIRTLQRQPLQPAGPFQRRCRARSATGTARVCAGAPELRRVQGAGACATWRVTAPYMHDGSARHAARGAAPLLRPGRGPPACRRREASWCRCA